MSLVVSMRLPSPASSCHSSDCEGDRIVHSLKRMKIENYTIGTMHTSQPPRELRRKEPMSMRPSPMVIADDITKDREISEKKRKEQERRKIMLEVLHTQMRQYKSQYTNITEGMDVAPCHGYDK